MGLLVVGSVAIGAMSVAVRPEHPGPVIDLGIGFCGLCGFIGLLAFIAPGRIIISPEGFRWRELWNHQTLRWSDVGEFRVIKAPSRYGGSPSFVGWDYLDGYAPRSKLDRFRRALGMTLAGIQGGLPTLWELDTPELAALLNQARTKWGPAATPH